ncbi:acid phosphatase [Balamuthia mandrillaris]
MKQPARNTNHSRFSLAFLLFFFLVFFSSSSFVFADVDGAPDGLHFFVIGDWGSALGSRDPAFADTQRAVAAAMQQVAEEHPISFVVGVGDNFYEDGVVSVQDEKWQKTFEEVYAGAALQKPWYSILGNHDYRGSIEAQRQYDQHRQQQQLGEGVFKWNMPSFNYTLSVPLSSASAHNATFLFLDTTPFIQEYYTKPDNQQMEDQLQQQHWQDQLSWFKRELERLNPSLEVEEEQKWIIVVGHHPIFSNNEWPELRQGGYQELQNTLLPLFKKHHVAAYLCGHVHDMEHVYSEGIHHFISGAGSRVKILPRSAATTRGIAAVHSLFHSDKAGFMRVHLEERTMHVFFYDHQGIQEYSHTFALRKVYDYSDDDDDPYEEEEDDDDDDEEDEDDGEEHEGERQDMLSGTLVVWVLMSGVIILLTVTVTVLALALWRMHASQQFQSVSSTAAFQEL